MRCKIIKRLYSIQKPESRSLNSRFFEVSSRWCPVRQDVVVIDNDVEIIDNEVVYIGC